MNIRRREPELSAMVPVPPFEACHGSGFSVTDAIANEQSTCAMLADSAGNLVIALASTLPGDVSIAA